MRIIPAMDIIEGKCVRLTCGDYSTRRVYSASPVDTARAFEDAGFRYLHMVDLDGARTGRPVNRNLLQKIVSLTSLSVDYGGGIRSNDDLKSVFEAGANQITAGSIAVTDPDMFSLWLGKYGAEKIILGADSRNKRIATHGWQDSADMDVVAFIRSYAAMGITNVLCTDISRDGMLNGPSVDLYIEILASVSVNLIASGGISSLDDLRKLSKTGCESAVVGKAIYEGKIELKELYTYVEEENNTLP